MNYVEQAERLVGQLYVRFLYRDLVYVGGGILILAVPIIAHGVGKRLVEGPWWVLVLGVLASYAAGFSTQEAGVALRAFRMVSPSRPFVDAEVDHLVQRGRIARAWGESSMLRLERIVALKHMSAVLGSSAAVTFLLMQLYYWLAKLPLSLFAYVLASVTLATLVGVMLVRNRRAAEVQDRVIALWPQ